MVLFNDVLSFPFVLLNKNWGEGEALLSKNPRACAARAETCACPDLKYGEILQTAVCRGRPRGVAGARASAFAEVLARLFCGVMVVKSCCRVLEGGGGEQGWGHPNSTGGTACPHRACHGGV